MEIYDFHMKGWKSKQVLWRIFRLVGITFLYSDGTILQSADQGNNVLATLFAFDFFFTFSCIRPW
jgi:hypothetical protein